MKRKRLRVCILIEREFIFPVKKRSRMIEKLITEYVILYFKKQETKFQLEPMKKNAIITNVTIDALTWYTFQSIIYDIYEKERTASNVIKKLLEVNL